MVVNARFYPVSESTLGRDLKRLPCKYIGRSKFYSTADVLAYYAAKLANAPSLPGHVPPPRPRGAAPGAVRSAQVRAPAAQSGPGTLRTR